VKLTTRLVSQFCIMFHCPWWWRFPGDTIILL